MSSLRGRLVPQLHYIREYKTVECTARTRFEQEFALVLLVFTDLSEMIPCGAAIVTTARVWLKSHYAADVRNFEYAYNMKEENYL